MTKKGTCYIGTSGWHYDHWRGPFYPEHLPKKQCLAFYAERFGAAEINNSFYQLPSQSTLKHWHQAVDNDFCFAVKASRYITHMKKLKDPQQSLRQFFDTVQVLRSKLGPVLFQLPPRWRRNAERLEEFLSCLPPKHRYVFEFRDESWFDQSIYTLLAEHNAAFCIYELAGTRSPEIVTADVVYIRLHGPEAAYEGSYSSRQLAAWARKCRTWRDQGKDVYCFFDNDQNGYAPQNALSLQQKLAK